MKIAIIIFSIAVNLFITSSERPKLGRTDSSFFITVHSKIISPRPLDKYVKKNIKLYQHNQDESGTSQTAIISENWFNGADNKSVEHTLKNFPEDAGGFLLKSSYDETKHEICKGYKVRPYYRNFMDGPNKESLTTYGINVKENNSYAIKIYVKKLGSKLHCFKIQSDNENQAHCLCALALSCHNLIALSVRGIHPHYNPLAIFKIDQQGSTLTLKQTFQRNSEDGLFFKKLSFLNEHELIGWPNIGTLILITCNDTITYTKLSLPKSVPLIKDYSIEPYSGDLAILTHEDMLLRWQQTRKISEIETPLISNLRNTCNEIIKETYQIVGIKLYNELCTIIAQTIKNKKVTTHFITANPKTFVTEK